MNEEHNQKVFTRGISITQLFEQVLKWFLLWMVHNCGGKMHAVSICGTIRGLFCMYHNNKMDFFQGSNIYT